ncbi:transposase [Atopobium sp. oral taxon 416]|nr:transposase [Atopobium sp. oral taxon 416]
MVDATYLKVRVDHRICPMALMIAMRMTRDKMKELIGFRLKACESRKTWGEVPLLAARPRAFGLKHVLLRRPRGARARTAEGLPRRALAALSGALLAQRLRRGPQAAAGVPLLRAHGDVQLRHA